MITKVINYLRIKIERIKLSTGYYNTHYMQKKWTEIAIKNDQRGLPRAWGKQLDKEDVLGDYLKIRDEFLLPKIINKTVLELGCLDGKWSKHIVPNAKHTFLVDLSKDILPVLLKEIKSNRNNFTFYETKGNELQGISNKTIDFIFCIDTLVRVGRNSIRKYFSEFKRVLKEDGKMLIHLPCNAQELSVNNHFTNLSLNEIKKFQYENSFNDFHIDTKTINHGVLLKYGY
tara:strand:+ start:140 stop:829 length:690 start_codon:yes stop_codon:yes gene_type:complete